MKPVSAPHLVTITGNFMPWRLDCEQPIVITVNGHEWLAVFSTEEKLHIAMKQTNAPPYRIRHIEDGVDFLASIGSQMPVCQDLSIENGIIRLKQLVADKSLVGWILYGQDGRNT